MSADRWQQLWNLYHGARRLDASQHDRYLTEHGASVSLIQEVKRLLKAQPPAGFLESGETDPDIADKLLGTEVDDFLIEGVLGEGGMGTVYLARETGSLSRPVAIKVVRRGMDTDRILRRFRAEQGTLARLDHPSIATVHRAGVIGDGRPYFVMQYVEGIPLTEYARQSALDFPARLELFASICDIVQYVHQKGVIHRDLKPSNILVSPANGQVTLIDFGIAKLIDTQETSLTREGQVIGTPEYMSPELSTGAVDSVDTRSDVFALGRILAELMDGRKDVARDLNSVIGKASAAERDERYSSAAELAQDVRRLLRNQPVSAQPPSRGYLLVKFIQRHPIGVGAGLLLVVSLAIVALVLGNLTLALRAALEQSNSERARAEQLAEFLVDTFTGADPHLSGGQDLTARELLDRGRARIQSIDAPPVVRARLLLTMANTYRRVGAHDQAESATEEVIALLSRADDRESLELIAEAHQALALLYETQSRFEDQLAAGARAWEIRRELSGQQGEASASLGMMGHAQAKLGRFEEAETTLENALDLTIAAYGPDHHDVSIAHARLGSLYSALGRFDEAIESYTFELAWNTENLAPTHPEVGTAHNNLATAYYRAGRLDDAQLHYRSALTVQLSNFEPQHPSVSVIQNNLAALYIRLGSPEKALPLALEALQSRRLTLGENNLEVGVTAYHVATANRDLGDFPAADSHYQLAREIFEQAAGVEDRRVGVALNGLGESLFRQGRIAEALPLAQRALSINEKGWPAGHRTTADSKLLLARIAIARGDADQAKALAGQAQAAFAAGDGAEFEQALATAVLAQALHLLGNAEQSRLLLAGALPTLKSSLRSKFIDLSAFEEIL